jgi:hypothetical protein
MGRLREQLNVSISELATTDPQDWRLLPGALTPPTLRPYHGRSRTHFYCRGWNNAPLTFAVVCGRKFAKATALREQVDCLLCLRWLRLKAELCCMCSVEWSCGCPCRCHRRNKRRAKR